MKHGGYNEESYNLMNINEFVSDEYISFNAHQHFGGILLNKLPLLRKLKWREVVTFKGVYGRLDKKKHYFNGLGRLHDNSKGKTLHGISSRNRKHLFIFESRRCVEANLP